MISKTSIITTLANYHPILLPETSVSAAVMLILLTDENNIDIVITERASHLPTYAGHYSFPGGMHDFADANLYATAVREVEEELHITSNMYQRIGQLDDLLSHEHYLVRPFVSIMPKTLFTSMYHVSADEIASLYYLSLENLVQFKDDIFLHPVTKRRPSYAFREKNVFIWGLTASILMQFFNVINKK